MHHRVGSLITLVASLMLSIAVFAQELHYSYDELGRLIESVDQHQQRTRYLYDPAGNLLQVLVEEGAPPPSVEDASIDRLRCGSAVEMVIVGDGLQGARIETADAFISITDLRYTDTGLSFSLLVDCGASLGSRELALVTAGTTIWLPLEVDPILPEIRVIPTPMAIPPDGSERLFLVRLSSADTIEHQVELSISNDSKATLDTAVLMFAAGEIEKAALIRGLSAGHTVLSLSSTSLRNLQVPVFVTEDFFGVNTSFAQMVGVQRFVQESVPEQSIALNTATIGVVLGPYLRGLEPSVLPIGSEQRDLLLLGGGLSDATAINILPDTGLSWSGPQAESNDAVIRSTVSVTEDAPITTRRVQLPGVLPLRPGADQLRITRQLPVLDAIDPLYLRPGDTAVAMTLRGHNLQDIESVTLLPSEGVIVGEEPSINNAGTVATLRLTVAADAPYGPRVLSVTTPAGSTSVEPSAANTFHVVPDIEGQIPSLLSAMLGVLRPIPYEAVHQPVQPLSSLVGVSRGAVWDALEPDVAELGQSLTLTLQGSALQQVDRIDFHPAEGIALEGAPLTDANGHSVSLPIRVAEDAALTTRKLKVYAGDQPVPPSRPGADQLRLSPGAPRIDSLSPLHWLVGSPSLQLQLRGERFGNGPALRVTPSDGIQIGSVQVNEAGSTIVATIAIDSGANLGARLVQVISEGGPSHGELESANTIYLVDQVPATIPSVLSAQLGVHKQLEDPADPPLSYSLYAADTGVLLETATEPDTETFLLTSLPAGLLRGPAARSISPDSVLPGDSYLLLVEGVGLDEVDAVQLLPGSGIDITGFSASSDGESLSIAVSVAPDAPAQVQQLQLGYGDSVVPFLDLAASQFRVGYGAPEIDSIEPILAGQGDVITLLMRGRNLQGASAVFSEPAAGLQFAPSANVNSTGTELTIRLAVAADASLGSRVIRVRVPGAVSGAEPEPANTFTVYESVP